MDENENSSCEKRWNTCKTIYATVLDLLDTIPLIRLHIHFYHVPPLPSLWNAELTYMSWKPRQIHIINRCLFTVQMWIQAKARLQEWFAEFIIYFFFLFIFLLLLFFFSIRFLSFNTFQNLSPFLGVIARLVFFFQPFDFHYKFIFL